jgi:hypothetical protein
MFKLINNETKGRTSSKQPVRGGSIRGLPKSKEYSVSIFGQNAKSIRDANRLVTVIPYEYSSRNDGNHSGRQGSYRRNSASPFKELANYGNQYCRRIEERTSPSFRHKKVGSFNQNTCGSFDHGKEEGKENEPPVSFWPMTPNQNSPIVFGDQAGSWADQYKNLYAALSSEALRFRTTWESHRFSVLQSLDKIQAHIMNLRSEFVSQFDKQFQEPNEFIESTLKHIQSKCTKCSTNSDKESSLTNICNKPPTPKNAYTIQNKMFGLPKMTFDFDEMTEKVMLHLSQLCTITMTPYSFQSISKFNQTMGGKLVELRKGSADGSTNKYGFPRTPTYTKFLDYLKKERPDSTRDTAPISKDYRRAIDMIFKKQKSVQETKKRILASPHTTVENFAGSGNNSRDKQVSDVSTRPQTSPKLAVQFDGFEFRSITDIPETISLSVNLHTQVVGVQNELVNNLDGKQLLFENFCKKNSNVDNPRYELVEEHCNYQTPEASVRFEKSGDVGEEYKVSDDIGTDGSFEPSTCGYLGQ